MSRISLAITSLSIPFRFEQFASYVSLDLIQKDTGLLSDVLKSIHAYWLLKRQVRHRFLFLTFMWHLFWVSPGKPRSTVGWYSRWYSSPCTREEFESRRIRSSISSEWSKFERWVHRRETEHASISCGGLYYRRSCAQELLRSLRPPLSNTVHRLRTPSMLSIGSRQIQTREISRILSIGLRTLLVQSCLIRSLVWCRRFYSNASENSPGFAEEDESTSRYF